MKIVYVIILTILYLQAFSQERLPDKAPLNPAFLEAIEQAKDPSLLSENTGAIPTPVMPSFKDYDAAVYANRSYPVVFDMRDSAWLTPVKSQTPNGCWAFATMGSVESRWKMLGLGEFDLSENNLKFCHGFDSARSYWGNHWMSTAYFARLAGPLLEPQDPNSGGTPGPSLCPDGLEPVAFIKEARYLPNDINVIKDHVMTVGAVYTMIYYSAAYYNPTKFTYYYSGSPQVNHAVDIVGWNDTLTTAGGQGAWIIRNSYGAGWGDAGYFYVSYNDNSILDYNCYWPVREDYINTVTAYLYDDQGSYNSTGYGSETGYGLVKFISSGKNRLVQVSSYAMAAGTQMQFEVYESFDGTTLSGLLGSVTTQTCPWPGLYNFEIPEHIDLQVGDDFYVKVQYYTPGYNWPIPIEDTINNYVHPVIESDVCWISGTGTSGSWWPIGGNSPGYYWDLSINVYAESLTEWTGATDDNWNNTANWSGGILPDTGDHVILQSGKANYPLTNSGSDIVIRSLEIEENAHFTLPAGKAMNVTQDLFLRSSASGSASFIDMGSFTLGGTAEIERYLSGNGNTYHYVSSPLNAALADVFTGAYLYEYDEPNQEWVNLASGDVLSDATGYNIKVPASSTYSFTGSSLHSGIYNCSGLTYNTGGPDDEDYAGWHLTGNPYPSAIDLDHAGISRSNVDNAIYYWDGDDGVYKSYVNGAGTLGATSEIPSGQGFFVRVSSPGDIGEVSFSNSARIHSNQEFYKSSPENLIIAGITQEDYRDECILRMLNDAAADYDGEFDAFKLMDRNRPQIYALSANNRKLSINSLPEAKNELVVPLKVYIPEPGKYTLEVSIPGLYSERYIMILEDKLRDKIIKASSALNTIITSNLQEEEETFHLHFIPLDINTLIYGIKGGIMIKSSKAVSGVAKVFNVAGQEVFSTRLDNSWMKRIDLPGVTGMYIVSIETTEGKLTEKVFLP
ncbi:MAG: T9SS type A sorting domain-containing protein [Bacteroidetes bacterium]|nr:T9SS type A sorting domain-containing protein [Bacteroidota bacterium]